MGGQTRKLKWSLDDLDLTKPIEPLSRFIDDPEKLIDEVFKIAAQYLPKDIVPSSLKDIPTVELKKLCLEQLKMVERKTLLNILTDGSNELAEDGDQSGSGAPKEETEAIASGSGLSRVTKDSKIQVEISPKEEDDQSSKKKVKKSKLEVEEKPETSQSDSAGNLDPDSILDQAEMELRELELRARAIRELLKKHEDADTQAHSEAESRKRKKTDPTEDNEKVQKDQTSADKPRDAPMAGTSSHRTVDLKSRESDSKIPSKATSRLSRNPVSMVEEDELEDEASSPTSENAQKARRKRSAEESNISIQLHNESDDSIDRELKGE